MIRENSADLTQPIEEAVQSIALLHNAHHKNASRAEKLVDVASALVSRPAFLVVIVIMVALWMTANTALAALGLPVFDAPPFLWLVDCVTLLALIVAVLIVISQQRAGKLAERREQMTLELTLLTEQKTAKIIARIEELRRDSPAVYNRIDSDAREMSTRVDPVHVLGAIEETASEIKKHPGPQELSKEPAKETIHAP